MVKIGDHKLMQHYFENSLAFALVELYPEVEWQVWRFATVPDIFWKSHTNRRKFFDWVATQLGIKTLDEWYEVKRTKVMNLGGSRVLFTLYSGSLEKALRSVYPEHSWQFWRFTGDILTGEVHKHRKFFENLGKEVNVKNMDDWYKVQISDIVERGGKLIVRKYQYSMLKTMCCLFPEHRWLLWRFNESLPNGTWNDISLQRQFFDWIGETLNIKQREDWFSVTADEVVAMGDHKLLHTHYGDSLIKAIMSVYPGTHPT